MRSSACRTAILTHFQFCAICFVVNDGKTGWTAFPLSFLAQSGQIMQAADLLANTPTPSDTDIGVAMQGHLCRCGTYQRMRAAIKDVAIKLQQG
ncbi:MAG: hypothetical protein KC448_08545 [Yoonia sp.]|nr:hypothetical protein [Yoonia sp.]